MAKFLYNYTVKLYTDPQRSFNVVPPEEEIAKIQQTPWKPLLFKILENNFFLMLWLVVLIVVLLCVRDLWNGIAPAIFPPRESVLCP